MTDGTLEDKGCSKERLIIWARDLGFATGHADTWYDLLCEVGEQIEELQGKCLAHFNRHTPEEAKRLDWMECTVCHAVKHVNSLHRYRCDVCTECANKECTKNILEMCAQSTE